METVNVMLSNHGHMRCELDPASLAKFTNHGPRLPIISTIDKPTEVSGKWAKDGPSCKTTCAFQLPVMTTLTGVVGPPSR